MTYFDPINNEGTEYARHDSLEFNQATIENRQKMIAGGFKFEKVAVNSKTGEVLAKTAKA